jgi:trans-aconitate 2-methyltransferase
MSGVWDPAQYGRFAEQRAQPFWDLAELVQYAPGMRVLDLGCGTGELTARLHEMLRAAWTVGIDQSAAMLAKAPSRPGVEFRQGDLRAASGTWDLVFSNAALQWVGDHAELLPFLHHLLAPGGQLAVQMPANHAHASHLVADEVGRDFGLAPVGRRTLSAEDYAARLRRLGFAHVHVREQIYLHELEGPEAVVEWVRGTLLGAFQERLPAERWSAFLDAYRARLLAALPEGRPYVYPFRRLLLRARLG